MDYEFHDNIKAIIDQFPDPVGSPRRNSSLPSSPQRRSPRKESPDKHFLDIDIPGATSREKSLRHPSPHRSSPKTSSPQRYSGQNRSPRKHSPLRGSIRKVSHRGGSSRRGSPQIWNSDRYEINEKSPSLFAIPQIYNPPSTPAGLSRSPRETPPTQGLGSPQGGPSGASNKNNCVHCKDVFENTCVHCQDIFESEKLLRQHLAVSFHFRYATIFRFQMSLF